MSPYPTKLRRAFRFHMRVVRLSTFCAVVGGVLALLAARSVYGSVTESVFDLNREWSRRTGSLDQQSYRVLFNGQALMTSSHMTDESVSAVLDAADAQCRARAGGLEKDVARLPQVALAKLTSFVFGVVHREWGNRGYVACIERGGDGGLAGLATDLREVARTGDVAKLGTFRYVSVDRAPGSTRTHVLRQWTEGSFNLGTLFPKEGDVPGTDLPEVARPDGARRVLDASVEGSHFGVRVYDAPQAPGAVLATYDRDLAARGWKKVELSEKEAPTTRVFDQGGADLFITATPNGERSTVSIASMPSH
jgi:hypothetical protein